MAPETAELIQAREAAAGMLAELGLSAYLFEVASDGSGWRVLIECATDGGWSRIELSAAGHELIASRFDTTLRRRLVEAWAARLADCNRRG